MTFKDHRETQWLVDKSRLVHWANFSLYQLFFLSSFGRSSQGAYYSLIKQTTSAISSHLQWILSFYQPPLNTLGSKPLPAVFQPVARRQLLPTSFHGPALRWAAKNAALQLLRTSRGQIVPSTLRTPSGIRVLFQKRSLNTVLLPAAVGTSN